MSIFDNLQPLAMPPHLEQTGVQQNESNDMSVYTDFLKQYEGLELTAYKPNHPDGTVEKHFTIGYGHFGEDVEEGMTTTEAQADIQLVKDVNKRLPKIKEAIPGFSKMPIDVRKKMLGSWFRGSLTPTGSEQTIKLINKGKYKEASKMFLKHQGYLKKWKPQKEKRLKENKDVSNSVAARMEETAAAILSLDTL